MSVFASALSLLKMGHMSEGSLDCITMYADELSVQGLIGCSFVYGDQVFSYCCHNSHSLYMAICGISCFIVIFAQKLSLLCRVSMGTPEIIWLLSIYCIKCPISIGQGSELPFAGYLTLWGLLSNETYSAASSCMNEWLALPLPKNTAFVAEQQLALKKSCDWISTYKSVLWNLVCYVDL
jgi:hypothetical protein